MFDRDQERGIRFLEHGFFQSESRHSSDCGFNSFSNVSVGRVWKSIKKSLDCAVTSGSLRCEVLDPYHLSLVTQHRLFLIGSNAIRNLRIPLKQHAIFFSNRSRIACLRAPFSQVLRATNQELRRSTRALLFATQILEIRLICSQQTRKHFLIATISGFLAHASRLAALTTLPPSPTMKSVDCILQRIKPRVAAVSDHGQLITNHYSRITGLNYV